MADLKAEEDKTVEGIKRIREDGTELWHARELALELDYAKWENFSKVTHRAILACRNSGFEAAEHFPEARKMGEIGGGAKYEYIEYELSRYACYLIVQIGDPRKEVIAFGQTSRHTCRI